ncbi:SRPBCC family protein, partial [Bacillus paranthracis]|nr:SRPBCC family protein [Bacillus paranthracis]
MKRSVMNMAQTTTSMEIFGSPEQVW